jgi:hypothetical protein
MKVIQIVGIAIIVLSISCKSNKIYTKVELENMRKNDSIQNENRMDYENEIREMNQENNDRN